MILNKLASWPLTSEVMEVKITKPILTYLLKIRYMSLVGDSKPLKTITFDLGGHWRSKYKKMIFYVFYQTFCYRHLTRTNFYLWPQRSLTFLTLTYHTFETCLTNFNAPLLWPNCEPCFTFACLGLFSILKNMISCESTDKISWLQFNNLDAIRRSRKKNERGDIVTRWH